MSKPKGVSYLNPNRDEIVKAHREHNLPMSQLSRVVLANLALAQNCRIKDLCVMCGKKIKTMAFKNEGVCSELCRKDRDNDHSKSHAIIEAPQGGERAV